MAKNNRKAAAVQPPERAMHVIRRVADEQGVPIEKVLSRSRRRPTVRARQLAMAACRAELRSGGRPASLNLIGRWFDRDHTTVLHACRRAALMGEEQ